MPTATTILDAHTTLQLRCLDRLYFRAFFARHTAELPSPLTAEDRAAGTATRSR